MKDNNEKKLKSLIIVESPGKIKTIKKIVGSDFEVKASMGHIIDLPENELSVDIKNGFEPKYEIIPGKAKIIEELKKEAEKCQKVYLAPDPDREGEAISWHLANALKLDVNSNLRVTFNAITNNVVLEALKNPKPIDMNKVNAQQSRRVLDRLVGYKLSPLLWDKLQKGLSAGRVQSVAVLLICKREEEIAKFVKEEYWLIDVIFKKENLKDEFKARLIKLNNKKVKIKNKEEAETIIKEYINPEYEYKILKITKKEKAKKPQPPFITSTLQQEASRILNFSPAKTMQIAQKLYEGIEIEKGNVVGLITYMRTDSYRVVPEAISQAREFIKNHFGENYLCKTERIYKTKGQAQDAHEAIRPTDVTNTPEKLKPFLTNDEYKLYNMIWKRFIASQAHDAIYDVMTVEIGNKNVVFKVNGETLKFPGFLTLYDFDSEKIEKIDENQDENEDMTLNCKLPSLTENEVVILKEVLPQQKFTKEPPRYTTASLIKTLEELKIGRPSTYATIVNTILDRKYVELKDKKFYATDIGIAASMLLESYFKEVINVEFTAKMEEELDQVEEGKKDWREVLQEFYNPFSEKLTQAEKTIKKMSMYTDYLCEKCNSPTVLLFSVKGKFLACSKFPYCRYTKNIPPQFMVFNMGMPKVDKDNPLKIKERLLEFENKLKELNNTQNNSVVLNENLKKCEKCGSDMVIKYGKNGMFLACSAYPKCKNAKPYKQTIGVKCPINNCNGEVVISKTKRGRIFYTCSLYPKCNFVSWQRPTGNLCPKCNSYLVIKATKKTEKIICSNKDCDFEIENNKNNE